MTEEYLSQLQEEYEKLALECNERRARNKPRSLAQVYLNPVRVSKVKNGHQVMDRMRELLNRFKRSAQQKEMHEYMLRCVIPQVYGDALVDFETEILEYNNFTSVKQEILISAPRRFGKSWAVAMFACVCLLCIYGVEVSIFSSGSRASGGETGMSSIIRTMLVKDFGVEKFHKDNQEHLYLKFAESDIRKLNAYPGSVHT